MNQVFHIEGQGISPRVTVYTDKIFRVTYGEAPPDSMIVTAEPSDTRVTAAEGEGEWVISTAALRAVVDKATLNVRFERPDGMSLSREYGKTLAGIRHIQNRGRQYRAPSDRGRPPRDPGGLGGSPPHRRGVLRELLIRGQQPLDLGRGDSGYCRGVKNRRTCLRRPTGKPVRTFFKKRFLDLQKTF